MQTAPTPKMTTKELAVAEQVGILLLPVVARMIADSKTERDDATAKFCREYGDLQRAREYLPDTAAPQARVELELKLLELAGAFVAAYPHAKA